MNGTHQCKQNKWKATTYSLFQTISQNFLKWKYVKDNTLFLFSYTTYDLLPYNMGSITSFLERSYPFNDTQA